jgi:CHAD domain-containing protein
MSDRNLIDCREDALATAGRLLRERLGQIFELRPAVIKSEDIEAVHDMRVVTRRMRSALRDLRPLIKKAPLGDLVTHLKLLADTLGEARDLDVAIVALEGLGEQSADTEIRDGIERLTAVRRERRATIQPALVGHLALEELDQLVKTFNTVFDDAESRREPVPDFREAGAAAIEKAIGEFLVLSDSLYRPSDAERLHRLRIAAKRLRYAIEFFGHCWGKSLKPFAREVAEMQGFLGELHDADVWIDQLAGEEQDHATRWLMSEFFRVRTTNHRGAFELWCGWDDANFIRRLRKQIREGL